MLSLKTTDTFPAIFILDSWPKTKQTSGEKMNGLDRQTGHEPIFGQGKKGWVRMGAKNLVLSAISGSN